LKIPDLLVIFGLISFLNIMLVTGSPFKNYTIYAQDNWDIIEDGYIFPPFEEESGGSFEDGYIFPPFEKDRDNVKDKSRGGGNGGGSSGNGGGSSGNGGGSSGNGGGSSSIKDDDGSGGGSSGNGGGSSSIKDDHGSAEDGGNEERINETTNDFSPLSSMSPNTDDKANPDNEVKKQIGQQSEKEVENATQIDQHISQPINQTVGNEVNQTAEQQQDIGQQSELQAFGAEVIQK
jgi:hypothetical protein